MPGPAVAMVRTRSNLWQRETGFMEAGCEMKSQGSQPEQLEEQFLSTDVWVGQVWWKVTKYCLHMFGRCLLDPSGGLKEAVRDNKAGARWKSWGGRCKLGCWLKL